MQVSNVGTGSGQILQALALIMASGRITQEHWRITRVQLKWVLDCECAFLQGEDLEFEALSLNLSVNGHGGMLLKEIRV